MAASLLVPCSAELARMKVQLVVACGLDRAIGERGTMPWYLPAELKHFKHTTMHTCLIMGRKTLESIGRALPQRRNIVVSKDQALATRYAGIEVAASLEVALTLAVQEQKQPDGTLATGETITYDTISLIGGARIFSEGMQYANQLIITEIAATFPQADTFFPEIDPKCWQLTKIEPAGGCYYFNAAPQPEGFAQERKSVPLAPSSDGEKVELAGKVAGLAYRFLRYERT